MGADTVRAEIDPQGTSPMTGPVPSRGRGEDTAADRRQPEPAVLEAVAPGHGLLVIQRGPRTGEQLPLDAERTLVGRLPEADICLNDVTVSRRHTEFLGHQGGHLIRDVGSLNGTYVNGERVDAAVLHAGDEIQIGKYRLRYHPAVRSE